MRVATEVLSSPKPPPHPSGLRPATFPLCGEGFKVLQIRRNLPHCGTFGYIYWELGRSAPVGGGQPGVPPLRRRRGKPGWRVREAVPYKRGGGRTMCAPTWRGGGKLPPHPSGLRPATFPPGGRLGKNKKGQVWDLPLETKRRSGASQKISLLTFFFKESKRPRFTTGASYLCVL